MYLIVTTKKTMRDLLLKEMGSVGGVETIGKNKKTKILQLR